MKVKARAKELRAQSVAALKEVLQGLLKEQFRLRMQHANGQLPTNHQLRHMRRDIARVKTVITEGIRGEH